MRESLQLYGMGIGFGQLQTRLIFYHSKEPYRILLAPDVISQTRLAGQQIRQVSLLLNQHGKRFAPIELKSVGTNLFGFLDRKSTRLNSSH